MPDNTPDSLLPQGLLRTANRVLSTGSRPSRPLPFPNDQENQDPLSRSSPVGMVLDTDDDEDDESVVDQHAYENRISMFPPTPPRIQAPSPPIEPYVRSPRQRTIRQYVGGSTSSAHEALHLRLMETVNLANLVSDMADAFAASPLQTVEPASSSALIEVQESLAAATQAVESAANAADAMSEALDQVENHAATPNSSLDSLRNRLAAAVEAAEAAANATEAVNTTFDRVSPDLFAPTPVVSVAPTPDESRAPTPDEDGTPMSDVSGPNTPVTTPPSTPPTMQRVNRLRLSIPRVVVPMELDNIDDQGRFEEETGGRESPSLLCDELAEKATPFPLLAKDLYSELSRLLECPVCLEVMRPQMKTVGCCFNGHVICPRCAKEMAKNNTVVGTKPSCPCCRSRTLDTFSRNIFVVSVLDALSRASLYKCQYKNCPIKMSGVNITYHEANCHLKPYQCPRQGCKEMVIFPDIAARAHACLKLAHPMHTKADEMVWNLVLDLCDIFSLDTSHAKVSSAFCPRILLPFDLDCDIGLPGPPLELERISEMATFKYKLYLSALVMRDRGGIMLYVSCLDSKEDVPEGLVRSSFVISGHARLLSGDIGAASHVHPVVAGTVLDSHAQGLFLTRGDLAHYITAMSRNMCRTCGSASGYHLHVQVREKIPQA